MSDDQDRAAVRALDFVRPRSDSELEELKRNPLFTEIDAINWHEMNQQRREYAAQQPIVRPADEPVTILTIVEKPDNVPYITPLISCGCTKDLPAAACDCAYGKAWHEGDSLAAPVSALGLKGPQGAKPFAGDVQLARDMQEILNLNGVSQSRYQQFAGKATQQALSADEYQRLAGAGKAASGLANHGYQAQCGQNAANSMQNVVNKVSKMVGEVQEGPGYQFRHGDEVSPAQYPFAYRLWRYLEKNGAVVGFDEKIRSGIPNQFHISQDDPEALGASIMGRMGNLIKFGPLIIPDSGMLYSGYQKAGPVWVRHIGTYDMINSDSIIQRWDVLVAKTVV